WGAGAIWAVRRSGELDRVLRDGARAAVAAGYGSEDDRRHCEDSGALELSTKHPVSSRAMERGLRQLGSMGSGNHFLEVQEVVQVFDQDVARAFGLEVGRVAVMIHSGSRGLGHQVCTDHVREMLTALPSYRIDLPDPQLACAPVDSPHGTRYLAAMEAAANDGRANIEPMTQGI